jgi:hypothetical protein
VKAHERAGMGLWGIKIGFYLENHKDQDNEQDKIRKD